MARPPPGDFPHESVENGLFIDWRRYREAFIYTRRTSPNESIGKAREMGGACTALGHSDDAASRRDEGGGIPIDIGFRAVCADGLAADESYQL